jgi:DNA-binding transcriptional ArsR family regulator
MMPAEPDMDRLARAIGEPTRLKMLVLLMEGRALTAKELAYGVGVGPPTCTAHLLRLRAGSLVVATSQGRHKYFRLASAEVARCVESLMTVAPRAVEPAVRADFPLRQARLCYDHLAGRLGLQVMEALIELRLIEPDGRDFRLTRKGERKLSGLGIDLPALRRNRRRFAFGCLDWSERRDHLGGALGAALAETMFSVRWLTRKPDSRCVSVTKRGCAGLATHFGFDWAA